MAKHGTLNDGKKKRLRKLSFEEISSVTRGAMEGADALILKRRDDNDIEKSPEETPYVLTSAIDGHTHGIWLSGNGGATSYQASEGADMSHDHPWIFENGAITIGESEGHTHTVDSTMVMNAVLSINKSKASTDVMEFIDSYKKSKEDAIMADDNATELEKARKDVADKKAQIELLTKMASLSDVEKTHLETLDEAGQTEFLAKSVGDRKTEIETVEKAKIADDPVVYTCADGTEIHKSSGPLLAKMAKERDEDRKELAKARAITEDEVFAKQGEDDFGQLPGERNIKSAIAKALSTITDEDIRKAAIASVRAGSEALGKGFKEFGKGPSTQVETPNESEAELDKLTTTRMTAENEDYFTAYDVVAKAHPELAALAIKGSN